MKLGNIALRLRDKSTIDLIGGAADYELARNKTLGNNVKTAAFVLPVQEIAARNDVDNDIYQIVSERFAVVVAVRMDTNHMDKTGFLAYNELDDIRQELFEAFLGLDIGTIDDNDAYADTSIIEFYQGQILDINRGYLWYQYIFEYSVTLETQSIDLPTDYLDTLYTQYVLAPSDDLPVTEDLPVTSFDPDATEDLDLDALR